MNEFLRKQHKLISVKSNFCSCFENKGSLVSPKNKIFLSGGSARLESDQISRTLSPLSFNGIKRVFLKM